MKRWQQNGLLLTLAWALAATAYLRYQELPKAQEYAIRAYYVCAERMAESGAGSTDACLDKVDDDWDSWMNRKWKRIAYIALAPIAAGWIAAFAGLFVYRRFRPDQAEKREPPAPASGSEST